MWQLVSGIGVLQVIAICKRRHRTAREMWRQSCKYHLRHRDASGQRTSLGLPDQRGSGGDRRPLVKLILGVDLRGGGAWSASAKKRKPPNLQRRLESGDFGVSEMGDTGLEPVVLRQLRKLSISLR
jgi:hypothetical protein